MNLLSKWRINNKEKKKIQLHFCITKKKNNYKQNGESITNKDIMNMLLHKNKFQ